MSPAVWLWCARAAWAVLPLTTGNALADALRGWSTGPARLATVLLWMAWAAGLLALFAPRPWSLTMLRVAGPLGVTCVVLAVTSTSAASAVLAIASVAVAVTLALSPAVARAAGNALAYGNEERFPLRIPTPLLLGPVPIAV